MIIIPFKEYVNTSKTIVLNYVSFLEHTNLSVCHKSKAYDLATLPDRVCLDSVSTRHTMHIRQRPKQIHP